MENPEDLPPDTFLLDEQHHDERGQLHEEMSHASADSRHPKSTQDDLSKPLPTHLFRQSYLLLLVSLYSVLATVAWAILCIQNKRPITTRTYDYISDNPDIFHGVLAGQMQRNADWFRTVKVLLAITNTLIIPLTSAVCASAAVIHVQSFGRRRHFSMRHTSTLADKGWTSPPVWLDLLTAKGWKSRASYFLIFAMAFHVLGMFHYLRFPVSVAELTSPRLSHRPTSTVLHWRKELQISERLDPWAPRRSRRSRFFPRT